MLISVCGKSQILSIQNLNDFFYDFFNDSRNLLLHSSSFYGEWFLSTCDAGLLSINLRQLQANQTLTCDTNHNFRRRCHNCGLAAAAG